MKRIILSIIFILLSLDVALSQNHYFRHFGRESGLSNLSVECAVQDSLGFMWIGTDIGLNRFDGVRFKNYFTYSGLPSNDIRCLTVGLDGRLWVGTSKGLCFYDQNCDCFIIVENVNGHKIDGWISNLVTDMKNNIWGISQQGLFCISGETDGTDLLFSNDDIHDPTGLTATQSGAIWVTSSDGCIYKYKSSSRSFVSYPIVDKSELDHNNDVILPAVELDNGELFIPRRYYGTYSFSPATGEVRTLFTTSPDNTPIFVHTSIKTKDGKVWLATENGIYIYDPSTQEMEHISKSYLQPYSLSDNAVHTLYQDKEESVWAGTFFGGLNYLSSSNNLFCKHYPVNADGVISGNVIREIQSDSSGMLWIGTEDGGICSFNPSTGDFHHVEHITWNGSPIIYNIQGLMIDGTTLWIATFNEGIYLMDLNTRTIKKHYDNKSGNGLESNAIVKIYKTTDGDILVGSMTALYRYDATNDTFHIVEGMQGKFIHDIYEDHNHDVWVAVLNNGLFKLNSTHDTSQKMPFPDKDATTLFEDSKDNLWVGNVSGGFYCYDRTTKQVTKTLLKDIGARKAIEDLQGRIWISSPNGLYCYNPKDESLSNYTSKDGLPTDQFNFNSGFQDSNGRIYFGTLYGLIVFQPSMIGDDRKTMKVLFTDVTPYGIPIMNNETLTLDYNQNTFSIEFAVLQFAVSQSKWFRYKINDETEWTILKDIQSIHFTELRPGRYDLQIQASSENGIWEGPITRLNIHINNPWWWTAWARMSYLAILIMAGYFLYKHYSKRKNEKLHLQQEQETNQRYREVLQSKIQFFTAITHEIRTPLTLIMGSIERMKNTLKNVQEMEVMERNTQRLLSLVNQLLDFRKIESSSFLMNFNYVDITAILKTICLNFIPAARQKNVEYQINIPDQSLTVTADEEALIKIFSNLLSNAIKFSEKKVSVTISTKGLDSSSPKVMVSVQNDGPRIPHNEVEQIFKPFYQYYGNQSNATIKGSGLGLSLAKSLVQMHNGTLDYDESDTTHNTFLLTLPLTVNEDGSNTNKPQEDVSAAEPTSDNTSPLTSIIPSVKPVILVVDDERELREFICEELESHYNVLQAENGHAALQILEKENVMLVITDIMMPIMDGTELCKHIREDISICHIPIIVLTAKVSMQDHINALNSQADAYIEKPFASEQLLAQVSNLLKGRELLRSTYLKSPYASVLSVASNSLDKQFLSRLTEFVTSHVDDNDLSVEKMAEEMNMSTSTLYRKVKSVTTFSPLDFIRVIRLKKAAELLASGNYRIKEVAAKLKFSSQAYFTSCFMKQFGITPSDFLNKKQTNSEKS